MNRKLRWYGVETIKPMKSPLGIISEQLKAGYHLAIGFRL